MSALALWVVIFSLAISPDAVVARELTGTVGGSLDILCEYDEGYETNSKYWCRGAHRLCTPVVKTSSSGQEVTNSRVSIKDNRSAHIFTVMMTQLREDDAGSYQCGIDTFPPDILFSLTVVHISAPTTSGPTTLQPTTISPKTTFSFADDTSSMTNYTSTYASANVSSPSVKEPFAKVQSDWVLMYLLPVLAVLLLLFLLAAVVFITVKKKRKSAHVRDSPEIKDSMQLSQLPPDQSDGPSYAVLNFSANTKQEGEPNTAHLSNSASTELCNAETKGFTQPCNRRIGVQSTVQAESTAHQQEVYANVQLLREDPTMECQYSTIKV